VDLGPNDSAIDSSLLKGVFSGVITNPDYLDKVGHPDDTLTGLIVSVYNLGSWQKRP
jgi:hypothetical protein